MKKKKLKSFIILFLFFTSFYSAKNVKAFVVHDPGHTVVTVANKILHGIQIGFSKISSLSLGLPGAGALRGAVIETADGGCEITEKGIAAIEATDTVGSIEAIAGSPATQAKLSAKIGILSAVINCKKTVLKATGASLKTSSDIQQIAATSAQMQKLSIQISSLSERIERLKEQRSEVNKEIWKAIGVRILMNAQSRLSTRLINNLVSKYKVGNVLQYVDAASTFVYTKDYIQKNFKESQDKAIMRTLLTNDGFHNKILPHIQNKAGRVLGYVPDELEINEPNYWVKLAQAGTGEADPYFLQTIMQDQASQAKAKGHEAAMQEISTGEGFVPVRNCSGAVAQQAEFDQKNIEYSSQVYEAEAFLQSLKNQRIQNPEEVSPEDIGKAQTELDDARKKLSSLPETNRPIVDLCDKIQNPGASVAKSINSYLQANLGSASNIKSENLPFFANFIEGVASNFVSSIIEGQKPGLNILTDAGLRATNIAANKFLSSEIETRKLKDAEAKNNKDLLVFNIEKTGTLPGEYTFKYSAAAVDGVVLVEITGPRNFRKTSTVSEGVIVASATVGGVYTLKVYNSTSQVLATSNYTLQLEGQTNDITFTSNDIKDSDKALTDLAERFKPSAPSQQDVYNDCIASGKSPSVCTADKNGTSTPESTGGVCGGNYTSKVMCVQQTNDQAFCNQLCGNVQGAYISLPKESIRGWAEKVKGVTPRMWME